MLVRQLHDEFQDDCRRWLYCSACSSLLLPIHPWNTLVSVLVGALLVQDGGVEGCALISSWENTKITNSCWITIDRRTLEPTNKDTLPKTKKKPQQDGRRGTITIKSNPIPASWVIHKLENNNTEEVLPLLWRIWAPYQASQPGDPTKELGIPKDWLWRPAGSDYRTSTGLAEIDSILGGHKQNLTCTKIQERGAVTPQKTEPYYLLELEDLSWRHGSAGLPHNWRAGSSSPGRGPMA